MEKALSLFWNNQRYYAMPNRYSFSHCEERARAHKEKEQHTKESKGLQQHIPGKHKKRGQSACVHIQNETAYERSDPRTIC